MKGNPVSCADAGNRRTTGAVWASAAYHAVDGPGDPLRRVDSVGGGGELRGTRSAAIAESCSASSLRSRLSFKSTPMYLWVGVTCTDMNRRFTSPLCERSPSDSASCVAPLGTASTDPLRLHPGISVDSTGSLQKRLSRIVQDLFADT